MFNVIQAALSRCHKVSLSVLKPKDSMYNCLVWVVVMFSFRETFCQKGRYLILLVDWATLISFHIFF